jgi:hypothetical protein
MALAAHLNGPTVLVLASSSTASTATQVSTGFLQAGVFVTNGSSVNIYVTFGTSTVQAAQPTTTLGCAGACFPPSAVRMLDIGPSPTGSWCSAATSAGSATLYVTPAVAGLA